MKTKLTIALFFISTIVSAQAPQKLWETFLDGNLTGKDVANSVVSDAVGNIFVTGTSYQTVSNGNFTTVKYDADGVQQWADYYNGTASGVTNRGKKLVIDKWQNIYALGTVALHAGDIAIVKYNQNGKSWSHNYEPYWFGSDADFGVDIAVDSSGYLYACGQVTSLSGNLWDMYTMKCDTAGVKIYEENFSSASGDDYPAGVAVTAGGNFFALTSSFDFFGSATYDIFTINYLSNWNHNWESKFSGEGNGVDYGTFIKVDDASNQYVCGTVDGGPDNDMVAMKQNQYGTTLWDVIYNGTANGNDTAVSVAWLSNDFVVVTGKCKEINNSVTVNAIVTMVIDNGTIVWTNKFYGTDGLGALPTQMVTDDAGNIYICGYESLSDGTKNGCIVSYDMNGNVLWNISYDGGINLDDKFNALTLDMNNDLIATGQTFTSTTSANMLTVKFGNIATGISEPVSHSTLTAYPNPARDKLNINLVGLQGKIKLRIFDLTGKLVFSSSENAKAALQIDVEKFVNGMYLVNATDASGNIAFAKWVKE